MKRKRGRSESIYNSVIIVLTHKNSRQLMKSRTTVIVVSIESIKTKAFKLCARKANVAIYT